jgi:hypothetical protein
MKKFSQASVLAKLLTGFSILIAMMLVLGIVSIYQLHISKSHIDKFRDNRMPGVDIPWKCAAYYQKCAYSKFSISVPSRLPSGNNIVANCCKTRRHFKSTAPVC